MTIDIQEPLHGISESLLSYVKEKVVELSHLNPDISRADVIFHEDSLEPGREKVCEIRLTVFGDSLFVQRRTDDFERSAIEAIEGIKKDVLQQVSEQNDVPDVVVSTVRP